MSDKNVVCRKTHEGVLVDIPGTFNLDQIAESGQCFRLRKFIDGSYVVVTGRTYVEIAPRGSTGYFFFCSWEEFRDVWMPYFDLSADYGAYQQQMVDDTFLREAIQSGGGIRILQQDLWEMVVTFVISQRNNIPRIGKSVDVLCKEYGDLLGYLDDYEIHAFPTAAQLREADLSCAALGYREKYIRALAEQPDGFWEDLKRKDDGAAKEALMALSGIGEKVANCVMLFGLHRMGSYPRDVWINRMIDDVYHGEFDPGKYAGFAGYVQQLQFYHYRKTAKGVGA